MHKPLSIVAHVCIVLGIAYTCWRAVAFFGFGPDEPATVAAGGVKAEAAGGQDIPVERITALHLFGRPAVAATAAAGGGTENLQETQLSLVLVGVFVADVAEASTALIARKGRRAESYRIGDRLPGNAKLEAIRRDLVVIARGAAREQISFEEHSDIVRPNTEAAEASSRRIVDARPARDRPRPARRPEAPRSPQEAFARYRNDIQRDPGKVLDHLGIGRIAGDGGYAVGALADQPELSHMGLQRGDRILSVNGRPVGDPRKDRLEIENIVAQGSAKLEIQRGDRRFTVTFPLN